jgi:hypothetical protein
MKRLRKITQSRRGGVSIAVAVLMAMIVLVSIVQNVLIRNQYVTDEDRERLQESLMIEQIFFDVDENLVISVRNMGAVNTQLIAVWVDPTSSANETMRFTVSTLVGIDQLQDVVLNSNLLNALISMTDEFIVTVFTERGTAEAETYAFIEPSPVGHSIPPLGHLGIFRVNWFYCRYSSSQVPPHPTDGPVAEATQINKSEDYVAFYIRMKNAWDHPCRIISESFLALTSIAPPQGAGEPNFFIVQEVDYSNHTLDPQIMPYDDEVNPIILYPNQTRTLIFATKGIDKADTWRWDDGYPFGPETKTEGSGIQATAFFEIYEYDDEGARWVPSGKYAGQTISTQAMLLVAS